MADNCLVTHQVRKYIAEKELLFRQNRDPHLPCEDISRYGAFVGSEIYCYSSLERAMSKARLHIISQEKAGKSVASGTVFLADTLIGSVGRFARYWHAPPGGLWGCLVQANTMLPETRRLLPLTLGVSCCEALCHFACPGVSLRWVNDTLAGGLKIGGFLVEGFVSPDYGEEYNLIGFGVNINNSSFPSELADLATSLRQSLGKRVDLQEFTLVFLAKLAWNIGLLLAGEDYQLHEKEMVPGNDDNFLIQRWKHFADTIGRRVIYGFDVQQNPQYQAVVTGIRSDGSLCLLLDDGSTIVEQSGELSYI